MTVHQNIIKPDFDALHLSPAASINGTPQRLAQGQNLFFEGDEAGDYYEVLDGVVRLVKYMEDGRRQVVDFACPGDFVGLVADDTFAFAAEAATQLIVVKRRRAELMERVERDAQAASFLMREAAHEINRSQSQLLALGRKSARERLAGFVLEMSDRAGRRGRPAETAEVPLSRQDIADYLGLTVETVCRALGKLKAKKLIAAPSPHSWEILDREQLIAVSKGV